jgi:hypothetical protein
MTRPCLDGGGFPVLAVFVFMGFHYRQDDDS